LTGVANWQEFADPAKGKEASVAYAISAHMPGYGWLATAITVAILAGFSSVILVMLLGQSRVFYSMSQDGLLPKVFADLHPTFRTPYKSNWILFVFVGAFAAFIPGSVAGDLTSFGTLLAFVLVSIGVLLLRKDEANSKTPTPTGFRTPLVPIVPILGAVICLAMIVAIDQFTLLTAVIWMIIGLVVYFTYSQKNSKAQQ
jgi:basic amino acid/polyamine antiporter, APA family